MSRELRDVGARLIESSEGRGLTTGITLQELVAEDPRVLRMQGLMGDFASQLPVNDVLRLMEASVSLNEGKDGALMVFVAELYTGRVQATPDSLIARVWNECLGAEAIPFDTEARRALIAKGLLHPELKRHIEAWQKMTTAAHA
jgi:hypothetical protein